MYSDQMRESGEIVWVYYGLGFVIKFLNIVCAGTIDCTF